MTVLAVTVGLLTVAGLGLALAVAPGGHHCAIGWRPLQPGEWLPRTMNPHRLWREHTACDTDACTWKRAAMTAMWRQGRLRPTARLENDLRRDEL